MCKATFKFELELEMNLRKNKIKRNKFIEFRFKMILQQIKDIN